MAESIPSTMSKSGQSKRRLQIVLALTSAFLIAEVIGGITTKSLALLADAGHMLTDVGGLFLALFAIWMGEKPASASRTYGYYRFEILAALTNALVLSLISIYILYEAYQRLLRPPDVASKGMFAVALIGLLVNVIGLLFLQNKKDESLNLKGAYFEVLTDLLSSVGVVIAAIIMWTTGWYYADPIISAAIGFLILPRTYSLMKDAVGVLLEGAPANISNADVRSQILAVPGVVGLHDLHIWSITSGMNAFSVHVVKSAEVNSQALLSRMETEMKKNFALDHVTIQIEEECSSEIGLHQ